MDKDRLLVGRDGDYLMQNFQRDICWLRNLQVRDPVKGCRVDDRLLGYIRRVRLDIPWSRASGTVSLNLST